MATRNSVTGAQSSALIEKCQICASTTLEPVVFLGFLPPVNTMKMVETQANEQPSYPAELLKCKQCDLCQLSLVVDQNILFPPEYPYTSGTTKILRDNFAEMYQEVRSLRDLGPKDLAVDIGSNDGTLLSNFHQGGHQVLGIEPTNAGNLANQRGIRTKISFFGRKVAQQAVKEVGQAKIITATNVFAHIDDIHEIVEGVKDLLADDGWFITESHYLISLLETVQYDTIYHEHLRYYSLTSLNYLFQKHGLEIIRAKQIPTHGGSIRVYAARTGKFPVDSSVTRILEMEKKALTPKAFQEFRQKVVQSKLDLYSILKDIKAKGQRVFGIGAPSRAATLINYVGLDDGILDCVLEVKGSYKIGKYMPGTQIPVQEEAKLFTEQPDYVMLLSWHIADELIPKLKEKGFKGKFIVPLPVPRVVSL